MLHMYLSRDRKENLDYMLASIDSRARDGRGGQILVVPEQFSHNMERRLCQSCGDSISRYAQVLSFSRLAMRVFSVVGGAAETQTDAAGKLLLMTRAVEQVQSRLKIYGTAVSKPEFLLQILDILEEFRSFCVTADDLRRVSASLGGVLAVKTEEFALLMESYDAVCANCGQTPQSLLTRLVQTLEDSDFAQGKAFYFDSFTDFNGVELEIIAQLLHAGAEVSINLTCDDLRRGLQPYEAARHTAAQLIALAQRQHIEPIVTQRKRKKADTPLAFLQERLFSGEAEAYAHDTQALHLFTSTDTVAQCRAVAGEILRLVQGGARFRDIRIQCADFAGERPVLASVLQRAEIPAYFAGTTDLLQEPVVQMLLSALESACGEMESEAVLAYIKSGFSPVLRDASDRLENYALLWKISGSRWQQPWTMNPYGFRRPRSARSEALLASINADRASAIAPLTRLRESLRKAKNTGQMVLALHAFLEEILLRQRLDTRAQELYAAGELQEAQRYAQVYGVICTLMEQVFAVLGDSSRSPQAFFHTLRSALAQYSLGTIPAQLDCVCVGSILSERQSDAPYVFVLGANEGAFPAAEQTNSLLTDDERSSLTALGIGLQPSADGRLSREMAAIHSALCAPSERLYLGAIAGKESYYFARAAQLFPNALCKMDDRALICGSRREYLTYLAANPALIAEIAAQEPALARQAQEIGRAHSYEIGTLSAQAVHALYGQRLRLSSSKIDSLASCRFAYFLRYGLRAQEQETAQLDAPLYGTFVHYVLENTVRQTQAEGGFAAATSARVQEIARQFMEKYASNELADLWDSERAQYLFRRTFDEAKLVVSELYEELKISQFAPQWVELEFSQRGSLPPVTIDGKRCTSDLVGFVDRADTWRNGENTYVRVVDYKTGKKDFDYTDVLHGIGMQMLLYLFALVRTGEHLNGAPMKPSGVLYFLARVEKVTLKDKDSEEKMLAQRKKNAKRRGVLLDDAQVLQAMEPCTESPRYLPYELDKEGQRVGDLLSCEQMALLEAHVFQTVADLADALYAGAVSANPYFKDVSRDNACAFCPYGGICRVKPQQYRWLEKVKGNAEFCSKLEERADG
ncbi:MAG: PD-(D/E)XK nuclease family protein [Oscillospiraceae bacterium]|jgi:ATP-dependent helicase/nuclease subunit B|nr:PD-(D/E)XK nuclease family protein [Oscillospiraceae bacterium]